jgi:YVTN family beta-propeller protein
MRIVHKIRQTLVFLTILEIMVLTFVVGSISNNTFAQDIQLHNGTLYEIIKQTSGSEENSQIDVGNTPNSIGINPLTNTLYVANYESDSVSVISTENNTKIKDIPVGNFPLEVVITDRYLAYVANLESDSVSVISTENNTKIGEDIPVGNGPVDIAIDPDSDRVYVANAHSRSVSVISTENNTKIGEDIPVGEYGGLGVTALAIDPVSGINLFSYRVYVANDDSSSVSVISGENNTKIKDIPVGSYPTDMEIDSWSHIVYVIHPASDSVSVISQHNDTKIKDIPVGDGPIAIAAVNHPTSDTVYVANFDSSSVSVISGENNTKIKDIPVGDGPTNILSLSDTVYVANYESDSVSVISTENNTKIGEDIPVGNGPVDIAFDGITNTVYVVNADSNGISVIDPTSNRVVAGITFDVNPFRSGYILCDGLTTPSPIQQYMYVYSGVECTARPNEGFEFVSWEENNLKDNSTQLITVSPSASPLNSIANIFGIELDEPEATFNITKFGTFTANFKELPPALPSEYLIPLYGIIISTIVGWSIPSIIGWARSRADIRKLNHYHKKIASMYGDGKLDENDVEPLDRLRSNIVDAYSKGQINEKHYESLKNETSILYEKIFRRRLDDALNNDNDPANKKAIQEQLDQIKTDIEYAYSEGKIDEKHYDLLNKAISNLDSRGSDIS